MIRTRLRKTIEQDMADDPYAQKVFGELLKLAIAEAEAMFDHPLKQYALFKDFEEKLANRQAPGLPDSLADRPHARAYFGAMRLVLGEDAFARFDQTAVEQLTQHALIIDGIVRTAVAENSLSPQNIEAAIRKGVIPLLFDSMGLDNAKAVAEQVIQITRVGLTSRMSQHSIPYGDERIRFTLRRQSERRPQRIAIHVEPDGRVLVDAPQDAPLEQVRAAVIKRARWISSNVLAARMRREQVLPREYVSGESLLYLGRRYCLKVLVDPNAMPEAAMRGPFVEVRVGARDRAGRSQNIGNWYRDRAKTLFGQRLAAVASPLRWVRQLPPTRIQTMARQWGSCSPAGRITLNPALVKAPRECIDYVLLHELCHLKHHNHSPRFYRDAGPTDAGVAPHQRQA